MRNAWRECQEELQAAEAEWFDSGSHDKYLSWVHKWTAFVAIQLGTTADEVDAAQRKSLLEKAATLESFPASPKVYN